MSDRIVLAPLSVSSAHGPYIRTYVLMWWCGDEICDCTVPQVLHVYRSARFPGGEHVEEAWSGTFESEASRAESAAQWAELAAAAEAVRSIPGLVLGRVQQRG